LAVEKKASDPLPKGTLTYTAGIESLVPTAITSLVASSTDASVFGTGTVGGLSALFRVDVVDGGEPGSADRFRIRISGGYDSGLQPLQSGNIQIH
jgi:hypothetical protein